MKTKINPIKWAYIPLFLSLTAFAESGDKGHGDSMLWLKNIWTIADPFVMPSGAKGQMYISEELKAELIGVLNLAEIYGMKTTGLREKIFSYDFVAFWSPTGGLPCKEPADINVPGENLITFACTPEKITFFDQDQYLKLNLLDQALGLIHERLHAMSKSFDHYDISVVVGAFQYLSVLAAKQAKGDLETTLTAIEKAKIDELSSALKRMGLFRFDYSTVLEIFPHGGIEYRAKRKSEVAPSAKILVGSSIQNTKIGENALIGGIGTFVVDSEIGAQSSITDSKIWTTTLFSNCNVTRSTIGASEGWDCDVTNSTVEGTQIGEAKIDSSAVSYDVANFRDGRGIFMGARATLRNITLKSTTHFRAGRHDSFKNSVKIMPGVTIQNGSLSFSERDSYLTVLDPEDKVIDMGSKFCQVKGKFNFLPADIALHTLVAVATLPMFGLGSYFINLPSTKAVTFDGMGGNFSENWCTEN